MTYTRRMEILDIISKLRDIKDDIDTVLDEEQRELGYHERNNEGSEEFRKSEEAINNLDDAFNEVRSVLDSLEAAGAF